MAETFDATFVKDAEAVLHERIHDALEALAPAFPSMKVHEVHISVKIDVRGDAASAESHAVARFDVWRDEAELAEIEAAMAETD